MLLDAAETVLGVFGFDRTLFGKAKDKRWWMQLKRNSEYVMIESQVSHQTTELVAFHKRKCKFLKLKDLATEDPDQLVMCEFKGSRV